MSARDEEDGGGCAVLTSMHESDGPSIKFPREACQTQIIPQWLPGYRAYGSCVQYAFDMNGGCLSSCRKA